MASSTGKGKAIFRVVSGNFLEMFDFMVFGFYATAIAKTFFPTDSAFASLMLALATFGAGFLARPLGAIFLGAYIDRHGRRKGLIITLALMAMGTVLIACRATPSWVLPHPCWCCSGACCKVFRQAWNWAGCRCTWQKSPHRAARVSSSAGSRLASRLPWCSQGCWGLVTTIG